MVKIPDRGLGKEDLINQWKVPNIILMHDAKFGR